MLGKLFKYEMKATARIFLPMLGALVGITLLTNFMYTDNIQRLLTGRDSNWVGAMIMILTTLLYGLMIGAVMIATLIVLIQRFTKNLMGDEGYLSMTLPVHPWQHLAAKTLSSGIWWLVNTVMVVLAAMVLAMDMEDWSWFLPEFWRGLEYTALDLGISPGLILFEGILLLLVGFLCANLPLYAAFAVGQLWRKHKIIGAVLVFIGITFVQQMVVTVAVRTLEPVVMNMSAAGQYHFVMLGMTLYSAVLGAACFLVTNYILSRRLDLE